MNANNETTLHPTTKEELRAIIEQELKRQGADADLNHIDVSGVTDMSFLFDGLDVRNIKIRNIKIDKWDTSNVTNMRSMFSGARYFNRPLSAWNTSNVTNMEGMFFLAESFNGDPSAWDVSNVTNMRQMFYWATSFNQPLSAWNTSNVTNKQYMLCGATSFNEGRKKSDTKQSFRDYLISRRISRGISRRQITLQV